ncbi:MAG: hypothetical protein ACRCSF_03835 [Mycobacteriaceae bacterium]
MTQAPVTETVASSTLRSDRSWSYDQNWLLLTVVALASSGMFMLFKQHLIDDTYITLSYAYNLAEYHQWALVQGMEANSATSPFNVLALSVLTVLLRDPVVACGAVYVLSMVLFAYAVRHIGLQLSLPNWAAPAMVVLIAVNPLMISSIGLEAMLGSAALAWLVVAMQWSINRLQAGSSSRLWVAGAVLGLCILIRLDLVIIALSIIFVIGFRAKTSCTQVIAAAAAVALPWFLWSWWNLGSALPDTLLLKSDEHSWDRWNFANGLGFYLAHATAQTLASCLLPALALGVGGIFLVKRQYAVPELSAWMFGAVLHFVAYCALGVPPYHWYYAPITVAGTVFAVAVIAQQRGVLLQWGWGLLAVVTASGLIVYFVPGLPRNFAPISTNHASSDQYEQIGHELSKVTGGYATQTAGEIGALAYFCRCTVVDGFSDRGIELSNLREHRDLPGLSGVLWKLNFAHLDQAVPTRTIYGFPYSAIWPDYELIWDQHPVVGAIRVWPVDSPTRGQGYLSLKHFP